METHLQGITISCFEFAACRTTIRQIVSRYADAFTPLKTQLEALLFGGHPAPNYESGAIESDEKMSFFRKKEQQYMYGRIWKLSSRCRFRTISYISIIASDAQPSFPNFRERLLSARGGDEAEDHQGL